ncbi:hypothetical protein GF380_04590 [Candidatus Uhrbacteria bacterium]|nr:hypothetical protein [Candidatus Uhrbacteria bacterium]
MRAFEEEERNRKEAAKYERGTSAARLKRHGNEEEEEEEELLVDPELELDKKAVLADLGIAPPLPRSILRPTKGITKKR